MTDTTPKPGVLTPERNRAEAAPEACDCVMYLGAALGSLRGHGPMPVIDWFANCMDDGDAVHSGLLTLLRARDAKGRDVYRAPLMVVPVTREVTPDELADAEHLYRTAVTLAAMFVEGA